ncbi:MAG: hypothetical protein RL701_4167 [Pseudomonadota bacterium]|jgi:hypothetical protein
MPAAWNRRKCQRNDCECSDPWRPRFSRIRVAISQTNAQPATHAACFLLNSLRMHTDRLLQLADPQLKVAELLGLLIEIVRTQLRPPVQPQACRYKTPVNAGFDPRLKTAHVSTYGS